MSRSGYVDDLDYENVGLQNLYSANLKRTLRGKRGQAFLREMASAMDAMPVKALIVGDLVRDGAACALGSVAIARGLDVSEVDEEDAEAVGKLLGISESLAREVAFQNDDDFDYVPNETDEARWKRMRRWIDEHIVELTA